MPVPPLTAQKRSGFVSASARTSDPSASIISTASTLSQFMPNFRDVKPNPPPCMNPPALTDPHPPPGTCSPYDASVVFKS